MAEHERKCAHDSCNCMVKGESKYCSEYCRGAKDNAPCQCGHPPCASSMKR